MTITLTPVVHGNLCHGSRWEVANIDVLAERVARVALGQYRHVAKILEGLEGTPPAATNRFAADAKSKLKVARNGDPWQRDGWLFQVISWITANQVKTSRAVIEPPHIFHAHKGFDGMQLNIANDGKSIEAVVIFEDKATTDPRGTIHSDVWPAIGSFEAGERITEIAHEVTGLLEAHQQEFADLNVDDAIDRVIWKDARHYRVSITTGKMHEAEVDRERLFSGYDNQAEGAIARRRAETMHFHDLRAWMNDFATLVEKKIDEASGV